MDYCNPKPVVVNLAPMGEGLVAIRRLVEPHIGSLALPGGYINCGETWREAAVREMLEETGIGYHAEAVLLANLPAFTPVFSAENDRLLIFALLPAMPSSALRDFRSSETSKVVVVGAGKQLAFPSHTDALNCFFRRR